ncbi:MAG: archease [Thermoplasmatales archaeon]|nr:archease [Thermoplasmatales archaeon]
MNVYKIIDHTADIGIEAYGKTLEEAFENTAKGMFSIITNGEKIEGKIEKKIEINREGDDEMLLVDWLSELIYLHDVEKLVFGDFKVKINDKLEAIAYGEKYDRSKHGYGIEIKAVTYHMLEIKRNKKGFVIRVLFDI